MDWTFPDSWKGSNVVTIHKGVTGLDVPFGYWPISLLSVCSKLLEYYVILCEVPLVLSVWLAIEETAHEGMKESGCELSLNVLVEYGIT